MVQARRAEPGNEVRAMVDRNKRGLVMVYTGNGKGKTTAALGLTVRAVGHGFSVYMIQFMKGSETYGEIVALRKYLPGVTVEQFGLETFVNKANPSPEDKALAARGLARAREVVAAGKHDLVILDEVNVAVDFNLIPADDVLALVREKPAHVDLVLTGRYARPELVRQADLVSEVLEIKHHYEAGVPAREGIEF
ncbi:MAG: cob(I)yrinic acid a,c-diamide adenosyltransferase [Bacillota bacterium]